MDDLYSLLNEDSSPNNEESKQVLFEKVVKSSSVNWEEKKHSVPSEEEEIKHFSDDDFDKSMTLVPASKKDSRIQLSAEEQKYC